MKFRQIAVAAVALSALGGCATYDYVGAGAPGGYYSGQPRVEYYGSYGYGYPYGGYYGNGYYGYPYGYYRPPYGYYPPNHHHHRPQPNPRPDHGDNRPLPRPPVADRPGQDRAPWRDLDRLVEQRRPRQEAPRAQMPQFTAPPRAQPAPRPSGGSGGRLSQAIERARQQRQDP